MADLQALHPGDEKYNYIKRRMRETIMDHNNGIPLSDYYIEHIFEINNSSVKGRFEAKRAEIENSIGSPCLIWDAFHGTPFAMEIANQGFDVQKSSSGNMFGKAMYLAPQSSKANQYAFGNKRGCPDHNDKACKRCTRMMLICYCLMGKQFKPKEPTRNIPAGYHSVVADPQENEEIRRHLRYPEHCFLHGDQILPYVLVKYRISRSSIGRPIQALSLQESVQTKFNPGRGRNKDRRWERHPSMPISSPHSPFSLKIYGGMVQERHASATQISSRVSVHVGMELNSSEAPQCVIA